MPFVFPEKEINLNIFLINRSDQAEMCHSNGLYIVARKIGDPMMQSTLYIP